ncbi:hypothetical protein IV102_26950 [bacterium]|nr:hypothetical protein [bacterium]
MAGQIRRVIDKMIQLRAKGDPIIVNTTRTKLFLKGVQIDKYDRDSDDDPAVLAKLQEIARDFGVTVE